MHTALLDSNEDVEWRTVGENDFPPASQTPPDAWRACQTHTLRLLTQAQETDRSLRERITMLGQAAQLTDQFYTLRMPALLQKVAAGDMAECEVIDHIAGGCTAVLDRIGALWTRELLPALATDDIYIVEPETLSPDRQAWLFDYYQRQIFPLLTPQAVDASRPFPHIPDGALTLLAQLQEPFPVGDGDAHLFVTITIPSAGPRLIPLPATGDRSCAYAWREDAVRYFAHALFPGLNVLSLHLFRVLRARAEGGLYGGQSSMAANVTAPVMRLDVELATPPSLLDWLDRHLHQPDSVIVRSHTPLAQADLVTIAAQLPERRNWLPAWLRRLYRRTIRGRKG